MLAGVHDNLVQPDGAGGAMHGGELGEIRPGADDVKQLQGALAGKSQSRLILTKERLPWLHGSTLGRGRAVVAIVRKITKLVFMRGVEATGIVAHAHHAAGRHTPVER